MSSIKLRRWAEKFDEPIPVPIEETVELWWAWQPNEAVDCTRAIPLGVLPLHEEQWTWQLEPAVVFLDGVLQACERGLQPLSFYERIAAEMERRTGAAPATVREFWSALDQWLWVCSSNAIADTALVAEPMGSFSEFPGPAGETVRVPDLRLPSDYFGIPLRPGVRLLGPPEESGFGRAAEAEHSLLLAEFTQRAEDLRYEIEGRQRENEAASEAARAERRSRVLAELLERGFSMETAVLLADQA